MQTDSQFQLLAQRRFLPLFVTQFFGAFNDNVFKQALLIYITFFSVAEVAEKSDMLAILSLALFILPFFLLSATAGQLADKYEKSRIVQWVKILEITIMLIAIPAFYFQSIPWLFFLLFLLGAQSTLFGPLKYSILPQHLSEAEIVGGNAMIEMGTFLAILVGSIFGGYIVSVSSYGATIVSVFLLLFACIGYIASRYIPQAPATDPNLKIDWNIVTQTWQIIQFTRQRRTVFLSILGISWFWALGGVYLSLMPEFTKTTLGYDQHVANLMFAIFSVGIGAGSLFCERLSGHKVELGLVPFGSIGLTLFGIDLYFAVPAVVDAGTQLQPLTLFLGIAEGASFPFAHGRILLDIFLIGMFGGFYIVPLYALVQIRSKPSHRSRIIAGNNVINALIMVVLVGLVYQLRASAGFSITEIFLMVAILNAVVAIYIYSLVPEFLMRFLVWMLIHTIYRVKKSGLDQIPDRGSAILVCNHVSLVDALIIGGCVRRPVRFVMYYKIFNVPVLNFIFRTARAIPIAGAKEDPPMLKQAFDDIAKALEAGDLICIFPEGKLTTDGQMNEFKTGVERILQRTPAPVVPLALKGLWGSFFSRKHGAAMVGLPKRFWSKIALVAGNIINPEQVSAGLLQEKVAQLRGDCK